MFVISLIFWDHPIEVSECYYTPSLDKAIECGVNIASKDSSLNLKHVESCLRERNQYRNEEWGILIDHARRA